MTKMLASVVLTITILSLPCFGADEQPAWLTDFAAFATAVTKAAEKNENLKAKFTNREIKWTVTFHSIPEKTTLLYFKEAQPLAKGKPPLDVYATLREDQLAIAAKLSPGDKVTVQGKIGYVINMTSPSHPDGITIIGPHDCVIVK